MSFLQITFKIKIRKKFNDISIFDINLFDIDDKLIFDIGYIPLSFVVIIKSLFDPILECGGLDAAFGSFAVNPGF